MEKLYSVVRKINTKEFKKLPHKISDNSTKFYENIDKMVENLWSMFDMKHTFEVRQDASEEVRNNTFGMRMTDYGITQECWKEFKEHAFHKDLFKQFNQRDIAYLHLTLFPVIVENDFSHVIKD